MSVTLNPKQFHRRARGLLSAWKAGRVGDDWQNADRLLIVNGPTTDEDANSYVKTTALQIWLVGFEFNETAILFTQDKVAFLTSPKKAEVLQQLKAADVENPLDLEILAYKKDKKDQSFAAENQPAFEAFLRLIQGEGEKSRVGIVAKDDFVIKEWQKFLSSSGVTLDTVDVSMGFSGILAVKDEDALESIRMAAKLSGLVMEKFAIDRILDVIDKGDKVSHEKLSSAIGAAIEGKDKKLKLPQEADLEAVEECYSPFVQSGGVYDLKAAAKPTKDTLHAGTIVCSLGVRYKSFCSNIARTFMIDPNKNRVANYNFLLQLQDHLLKNVLKNDVPVKEVYDQAVAFIKQNRPELEQYFLKTCGFSMGAEMREAAYVLNNKVDRKLKTNMVFNLALGFQNIPEPTARDSKSKTYSLYIADTVVVGKDDSTVLTSNSKKDEEAVCYYFEDDDPKEKKENKQPNGSKASPVKNKASAILPTRTRNEQKRDEADASIEARRRAHQKQLADSIQQAGLKKYQDGDYKNKGEEVVVRKPESYKRVEQVPSSKEVRITVDASHQTVLLPIYGIPVPFHIAVIKNVTKSDEGDYTVLRFNFIGPGLAGKKTEVPYAIDDPTASFIRAIAFRSTDSARFENVHRQITEMKKDFTKSEAERKERADLVEQAKLQEMRGRRPFLLKDCYIRPQPESRRTAGDLEIHSNGLRYQTTLKQDHRIDILFSNIKHLFYQPCEQELFVLIHCHLKHPIMIGKKKTRDVQFYRDVSDATFDETGNRKRRTTYGDEDELQAEEDERRRRKALNREFKEFSEKIREQAKSQNFDLDVEVPLRSAGFKGVAHRELVRLMPTENCLVQLSELPNLVIDIAEVEKVHLERVQFGLKNFDMVFIFKDYARPVVHINSIPIAELEHVKEWLDEMDIAFTEGPVNLVWTQIMKTVNEDPAAFFRDGGWSFLDTEHSDHENDSESDVSEYMSEGSDEEESSSEDSESDFDAESEDDSSPAEDDESGEDWDELEAKARKSDEKKEAKRKGQGSDDDRPSKKRK
ncbi:FACT complex subunit-domain-containing protein [Hyaloraphidium curvatum]|nr:FACT complex subunit-domain-containing protein [Hyaloraphidium curvatum]